MCCLKNEQEAYEDINHRAPSVGSFVKTPDGKGTVSSVSLLKELVTVMIDNDGEKLVKEYKVDDVKILKKAVKNEEKVDMKALKQLED